MRDHNKLRAYELADNLAVYIYLITKDFPKEEIYGLTSQMRRAAVSVPSNIVEGCARQSENEYLRFLDIAYGSLKEFHYQFLLANKLQYIKDSEKKENEEKIIETEKVLSSLIRALKRAKSL